MNLKVNDEIPLDVSRTTEPLSKAEREAAVGKAAEVSRPDARPTSNSTARKSTSADRALSRIPIYLSACGRAAARQQPPQRSILDKDRYGEVLKRRILGKWREGFCLDVHTISSVFVGYDEFGHPRFDTQRSEIGELLYRLKNKGDKDAVEEIVAAAIELMAEWHPPVDILVPVPPSTQRAVQPVTLLTEAIGRRLRIPLVDCIKRTHDIPQLKNVFDLDERTKLLEGLHTVDEAITRGKTNLALRRSVQIRRHDECDHNRTVRKGRRTDVFALTITRTRSNQ